MKNVFPEKETTTYKPNEDEEGEMSIEQKVHKKLMHNCMTNC